jgi:hypothetical protein
VSGTRGSAPPDAPPPPAAGLIAGLIAANTSLLVAVLVYMGWAYDNAYYGHFHLSPLDLGAGISEYLLRSLNLFSQDLVFAALIIIIVAAARTWSVDAASLAQPARRGLDAATSLLCRIPVLRRLTTGMPGRLPLPKKTHPPHQIAIAAGGVITAAALLLAWIASSAPVSTYWVLALLSAGPLLLTWPNRGKPHGLFPYAMAIVVAAVCALWATSLYAQGTGTRNAQNLVRHLTSRTAVALYSTQRLALSGPGVTVAQLPPGAAYHFEYQGLRLLTMRSGVYYLLPVGWGPGEDLTYAISDSGQIRVVLLSG